jgi:hypothetical protein
MTVRSARLRCDAVIGMAAVRSRDWNDGVSEPTAVRVGDPPDRAYEPVRAYDRMTGMTWGAAGADAVSRR